MRNPFRRPQDDMVLFSATAETEHVFTELNEIHLSGTDQVEREGFVEKEILRTGEWPVIPTRGGKLKRPLRIVRDGRSDKERGIISLQEVVENFKKSGINVQIPLSDNEDDHKNITATNTGYVREVFIRDTGDGARLIARMEFTEPDVKDKVLRGTYSDVSCGIPWEINVRGEKLGSTLEHVAITNRPFIDGLGPFLALSDEDETEIEHYAPEDVAKREIERVEVDPFGGLSVRQVEEQAKAGLEELGFECEIEDIKSTGLVVKTEAGKTWEIPFSVKDSKLEISTEGWTYRKTEGKVEAPAEQKPAVPSQPEPVAASDRDSKLEAAQRLREIRLSGKETHTKEENMPLTREELDGLALSDEQKAAIQTVLDENVALSAKTREGEADKRVSELEGMGLKERPGFLKLYREVMLSDDGGSSIVLLSDGKKESLTAIEILDRAIDALKAGDGSLALSDQALVSGNDIKPPADAGDETLSLEDRVAAAKSALGKK